MARMPVPGQPPQVRRRDRVRRVGQPVLPARQLARPPRRLELGQVPRRPALHRPAVDYYRRAVRPAGEEVRRVHHALAIRSGPRSPPRTGPSRATSHDRVPATTHTRRDRRPWTTTTGPADAAALSARRTAAPEPSPRTAPFAHRPAAPGA